MTGSDESCFLLAPRGTNVMASPHPINNKLSIYHVRLCSQSSPYIIVCPDLIDEKMRSRSCHLDTLVCCKLVGKKSLIMVCIVAGAEAVPGASEVVDRRFAGECHRLDSRDGGPVEANLCPPGVPSAASVFACFHVSASWRLVCIPEAVCMRSVLGFFSAADCLVH